MCNIEKILFEWYKNIDYRLPRNISIFKYRDDAYHKQMSLLCLVSVLFQAIDFSAEELLVYIRIFVFVYFLSRSLDVDILKCNVDKWIAWISLRDAETEMCNYICFEKKTKKLRLLSHNNC